jgi:hypothetical protein
MDSESVAMFGETACCPVVAQLAGILAASHRESACDRFVCAGDSELAVSALFALSNLASTESSDPFFAFLFYVAGIIPSDGCAKQLSQGGNAEFFFRASAVGLDRFQT